MTETNRLRRNGDGAVRYPDFICLGAQKAATSWLYHNIQVQPGVFTPPIKELHYFSQIHNKDASVYGPKSRKMQVERIRKYRNHRLLQKLKLPQFILKHLELNGYLLQHLEAEDVSDEWYGRIFAQAAPSQTCVEISPCYMNLPEDGMRHLMSLNPQAKLLVIVRDPIDRCWAQIRMHVDREPDKDILGGILDGSISLLPFLFYTDYARSIEAWRKIAPAKQLKILMYDAIKEDSAEAIKDILKYAGMDEGRINPNRAKKSVFEGTSRKLPRSLHERLVAELEPQYSYLKRDFPETVDGWLKKHDRAILPIASGEEV